MRSLFIFPLLFCFALVAQGSYTPSIKHSRLPLRNVEKLFDASGIVTYRFLYTDDILKDLDYSLSAAEDDDEEYNDDKHGQRLQHHRVSNPSTDLKQACDLLPNTFCFRKDANSRAPQRYLQQRSLRI